MEHDHMSAPPKEGSSFRNTVKHLLPHHKSRDRGDRKASSVLPHYNFATNNSSTIKSAPPPYSQSRDLKTLNFGTDPGLSPGSAELAPMHPRTSHHDASQKTLPSISSVTGTQPSQSQPRYAAAAPPVAATSPPPTSSWVNTNPFSAYYSSSYDEQPMKLEPEPSVPAAPTVALNKISPDTDRASSVSLDDPDVRMAAEALGDLRADFLSSPPMAPTRRAPLPPISPTSNTGPQPEPLISLLTTSHPILAKTIEGTTSAYNTSKNFSPAIRTSVEYVEGYLTPISNTIGTVGRATGVEGGVRWFLGAGRRNVSDEVDDGSHKRRKLDTPNHSRRGSASTITSHQPSASIDTTSTSISDPYAFASSDRRLSFSTIDTLPAYDDARSPAYTEAQPQTSDGGPLSATSTGSSADHQHQGSGAITPRSGSAAGPAAWQQRLIMSTSGLSIAMSDESLRRLKYCLRWLRWANEHIASLISTLKAALEQYERGDDGGERGAGGALEPLVRSRNAEMVHKIAMLKTDITKTLREVIHTVSKYAGGSLPENASELVRRHLTSLPQRFRLASQTESSSRPASGEGMDICGSDEATKEAAQKVLLLAKEGLDMMAQVSGVLDGTIVSAEEWCGRLGRRRNDETRPLSEADSGLGRARKVETDGDSIMSSL